MQTLTLSPMLVARFAPHQRLAEDLLPHAVEDSSGGVDGAHDLAHLARVYRNAMAISAVEGGDREVIAAATLLHDCVAVEKNHPDRARASQLAADKARSLLVARHWPTTRVDAVAHAITAHSYSAGIEPETLEACILQDADRLDSLGAMGVARTFYIAGRMRSALYDDADPGAESRPLDDRRFAIDHFPAKLLRLAEGFRTETGRQLARQRHDRLQQFFNDFMQEV